MKKLFFCALAGAIGFVGAKTYLISQESGMDALTLQNVEALSEGDLPGSWRQNFVMGTVWYKSATNISYTQPFITWGWSSMRCCLTSVDANACNFSVEDEKCSRYAIRSAH